MLKKIFAKILFFIKHPRIMSPKIIFMQFFTSKKQALTEILQSSKEVLITSRIRLISKSPLVLFNGKKQFSRSFFLFASSVIIHLHLDTFEIIFPFLLGFFLSTPKEFNYWPRVKLTPYNITIYPYIYRAFFFCSFFRHCQHYKTIL